MLPIFFRNRKNAVNYDRILGHRVGDSMIPSNYDNSVNHDNSENIEYNDENEKYPVDENPPNIAADLTSNISYDVEPPAHKSRIHLKSYPNTSAQNVRINRSGEDTISNDEPQDEIERSNSQPTELSRPLLGKIGRSEIIQTTSTLAREISKEGPKPARFANIKKKIGQQSSVSPNITIHIGRIEVRAVRNEDPYKLPLSSRHGVKFLSSKSANFSSTQPVTSLQKYLRSRTEGRYT